MPLYDVLTVDVLKSSECMETEMEAETAVHANHSQSHVLTVVRKILFHSNQAVIVQFCVGIVSKHKDRDKSQNYELGTKNYGNDSEFL
jgi:hypothetical protein